MPPAHYSSGIPSKPLASAPYPAHTTHLRPHHPDFEAAKGKQMKVEFHTTATANKDARRALQTIDTLRVALLPSGEFAIEDRGQTCFVVVDDLPTSPEEFRAITDLLNSARMRSEASFYGEPDVQTLARDIRRANQPTREPSRSRPPLTIEIDL